VERRHTGGGIHFDAAQTLPRGKRGGGGMLPSPMGAKRLSMRDNNAMKAHDIREPRQSKF
jgi:hypothetical protein